MPRKARKDLITPFLHVMVQGVNKEYIFYKEDYIKKYLEIVKNNNKKYNVTIMAYCIMNNHAHFLMHTENINELGKFMQKNNLTYAQMYNKKEKRCGVLFRNRYQTEPITDLKHLINCINYIHKNPVKAKMVDKCEDYKYSSYCDYIRNEGVTKSRIMGKTFGSNCNYLELFAKANDRRYIDIDEDKKNDREYLQERIEEFMMDNNVKIIDILENRSVLRKLIEFLNKECQVKFGEISNFFEISNEKIRMLMI